MGCALLQWTPTREGYLRFLAESKAVYDALEAAVQDKTHPECKAIAQLGQLSHRLSVCADTGSEKVVLRCLYIPQTLHSRIQA